MPPSINALYVRRRGGQVALSDKAHRYREHVKKVVSKNLAKVSAFPAENDEVLFSIEIEAHFQGLENPNFFERISKGPRKGERKAKRRYKAVDADNRIKFVQDCLVKSLGIPDDSQVFEVSIRKVNTVGDEKVLMTIREADRARFFPGG